MSRTTVEMVTYQHKGKTMTRKKRDTTFGTLKRLKSGKFQPIYLGPDKSAIMRAHATPRSRRVSF